MNMQLPYTFRSSKRVYDKITKDSLFFVGRKIKIAGAWFICLADDIKWLLFKPFAHFINKELADDD